MKIVVVGAGISGLTSAYRLQQLGHDVVVVEASDRVGGRCNTVYREGFIIDTGPELTPASYDHYWALVRELGLEEDVVPASRAMALVRDGRAYEIDMSRFWPAVLTPALSFGAKMRLLIGVIKHRKLIKRANGYRLIDMADLEDPSESAQTLSVRAFGQEAADYLMDALMKALAGTHMRRVSALMVYGILHSWSAQMLTLRGGLHRFPRALAEHLDIQLSSPVTKIEDVGSGVRVTCRGADDERIIEADRCLIAAQFDDAEKMAPALREIAGDYGAKMEYCRVIDVKLAYDKATRSRAYPGFASTIEAPDMMMYTLVHNKSPDRVPAGCSLFTVYSEIDAWEKLNPLDDAALIEWARSEMERLYPEVIDGFRFGLVNRQPKTALVADPDFHRRTAKLLDAVAGMTSRVELGGDIFGQGSMEAAVLWGEQAVERMLGKVSTSKGW